MQRPYASQGLYTRLGLGHRLQALLIDVAILAGLLILSFGVVFGWPASIEFGSLADTRPPLADMTWLDWLFALTFPHGVILGCWMMFGTSPGKRYLGAFIVDNQTGLSPRPWQFLVRYLCVSAPYLAALLTGQDHLLLGYSAYVLIVLSPRRRAWHDYCAGTLVVRPIGSGSTILSFAGRGTRPDPSPPS